jgi:3',5'-cyclic AMP phosphodiesterase CpdA
MPFPNLSKTALVQPAQDEFTFAVLGDYRPARRDIPYPEVFTGILKEIGILHPSLVISAGDAYYGYGGSFQRFKNEVARFMSRVDTIGVPFYNAIGNHEVADDPERVQYVNKLYGRLYGSFDVCSTHFIALNTEETGREGTISGEQLAWLKKDLDANKSARAIFVFLHRPLFSAEDPDLRGGNSFKHKDNRDALHEVQGTCGFCRPRASF